MTPVDVVSNTLSPSENMIKTMQWVRKTHAQREAKKKEHQPIRSPNKRRFTSACIGAYSHEASKQVSSTKITYNYRSGQTEIEYTTSTASERSEGRFVLINKYHEEKKVFAHNINKKIDQVVVDVKILYQDLADIDTQITQMNKNTPRETDPSWEGFCSRRLQAEVDAEFEKERILRCIQDKVEEQRMILRQNPPFIDVSCLEHNDISLDGDMIIDYSMNNDRAHQAEQDNLMVQYRGTTYPINSLTKMMLDVRKLKSKTKSQFLDEQKERKKWHESRTSWKKAFQKCRTTVNVEQRAYDASTVVKSKFLTSIIGRPWEERKRALTEFLNLGPFVCAK